MKVKDFNLQHWQDCLTKFLAEHKDETGQPAIRIENTQLTIARYYGGIKYNGRSYTYFEPKISGHEPNPDGSPYVAWLMVRDDFLRFATKEAKKMGSTHSMKDDVTQGELLV